MKSQVYLELNIFSDSHGAFLLVIIKRGLCTNYTLLELVDSLELTHMPIFVFTITYGRRLLRTE